MTATIPINGRTDGQPAPRGRVGGWLLYGENEPLANRGVRLVNPWASDAECSWQPGNCNYVPTSKSVHEMWAKIVDPMREWLCAGDQFSPIIDIERASGHTGDLRRYFTAANRLQARRAGIDWILDGMPECVAAYTQAGVEVAIHQGRLNSDQWANEQIAKGNPAEVLDAAYVAHRSFVKAGARIGMDNLSAASKTEPDAWYAAFLRSLGVPIQCEGTPDYKHAHFKGYTSRIVWMDNARTDGFHLRHVKQEPWAVGLWPSILDPEFAKWYPDLRVILSNDAFGANPADLFAQTTDNQRDVPRREKWMKTVAAGCKDLLGRAPTVRVLLHERHIAEARAQGLKPGDFQP